MRCVVLLHFNPWRFKWSVLVEVKDLSGVYASRGSLRRKCKKMVRGEGTRVVPHS